MKKGLLMASVLFVASCGGGGTTGVGGTEKGFYSLELRLGTTDIQSPAVSLSRQGAGQVEITLPPDTISGKLSFRYSGTQTTPLIAFVQSAKLCVLDSCYSLPITGTLVAGSERDFSFQFSEHKMWLPWIAVNPYEDKVLNSRGMTTVALTGGGTARTETDFYFGGTKTRQLSYVAIRVNSFSMDAKGDFRKSDEYSSYTTALGTVNKNLNLGSVTGNTVKPNSVRLTVGNLKCKDDGNGNIVEDSGTPQNTCNGTIDYRTGQLGFQIQGVNSPSTVLIDYVVSGSQRCMDDGNGNLILDCSGSINYASGQLSYSFNAPFLSYPVDVNITYIQSDASGNQISYNLPPITQVGTYLYRVYGRVVEVYQGTTKLCDNQGFSSSCTVQVDNSRVLITFSGSVLPNLTLKYSVEDIVDINPSIDARQYNGLYDGTSTPTVQGYVEVKVRLQSGETFTAKAPIIFRVRGQ